MAWRRSTRAKDPDAPAPGKAAPAKPVSSRTIPPARPGEWPPIDTPVVIVLPKDGGVFTSKVTDHDRSSGSIIVLAPAVEGDQITADPGDTMMTTWTTSAGLHELKTEFVESPGEAEASWKIEPASPVVVHERRRFPRVRRGGGVRISAGSQMMSATMLDLSEGGVRCVIDTNQALPSRDLLETTLHLDNTSIRIKGWVAWKKVHGRHTEIGVSFAGLSKKETDLIRRYVVTLQQHQQARRS